MKDGLVGIEFDSDGIPSLRKLVNFVYICRHSQLTFDSGNKCQERRAGARNLRTSRRNIQRRRKVTNWPCIAVHFDTQLRSIRIQAQKNWSGTDSINWQYAEQSKQIRSGSLPAW